MLTSQAATSGKYRLMHELPSNTAPWDLNATSSERSGRQRQEDIAAAVSQSSTHLTFQCEAAEGILRALQPLKHMVPLPRRHPYPTTLSFLHS